MRVIARKNCNPELAPILTRLSGALQQKSIFQMSGRLTKKDLGTLPATNCPIPILCFIRKIMDKYSIFRYPSNELIRDKQHGFRHLRSTAALLCFVNYSWLKSLELYGQF